MRGPHSLTFRARKFRHCSPSQQGHPLGRSSRGSSGFAVAAGVGYLPFDFFTASEPSMASSDDPEDSANDLSRDQAKQFSGAEPRCRHYALAHVAMRTVAFPRPAKFLAVLASESAREFLEAMIESVNQFCESQGKSGSDLQPEDRLDASDFQVHPVRIKGFPCAIIEFPPPMGITEAYFVAAVLLDRDAFSGDAESGGQGEDASVWKDAPLRYFTLERGAAIDGQARTGLCEWTAGGSHRNYGDGPPPNLAEFAQAVAGRIRD